MPNLNQILKGIPDAGSSDAIRKALQNLFIRANTVALEPAGLAIGTGSAAKVKIVNDVICLVESRPVKIAAASEVTLAGTIADAAYNAIAIETNAAGTVSAKLGTAATTQAAVVLPAWSEDKARLGYAFIHASGAAITLGTTLLNSGQCIVDYVDTPGMHDFTLKADSNLIGD